jgi:hypothetical protein
MLVFLFNQSQGQPGEAPFGHSPRLIFAILGARFVTILLVCINGHKKTTNRSFLYTNLITFGPAFPPFHGGLNALLRLKFQEDRISPPEGSPPVYARSGMIWELVYEIMKIVY